MSAAHAPSPIPTAPISRVAGCSAAWPCFPEARRGGFGAALLAESERLAREAGATEMHLHAQCRVTPFYGRMGYAQYGPVELDEHVEHIWMEKLLDETGGRG